MHLGIGTYSFPWAIGIAGFAPEKPMTTKEVLQVAIDNYISHIQYGDNLPLHHLSCNELTELADLAKKAGVNIEVGTRKLTEDNVIQHLNIAKTLGSSFLRVVIDDQNFHPSEDEVKNTIRNVLPLLQRDNICLGIENHDRFTSLSLERIINETDSRIVGICLDTANSLGALEGPYETIKILAPYTINLHLKDVRIERLNHKMGFTVEGCAAGDGMLNIPWIIEHVKTVGKCKTATLEVWSTPEETIEQTIIKERNLVNKSLQNLKKYFHE